MTRLIDETTYYVSRKQTAEALGCSREMVRQLVAQGWLSDIHAIAGRLVPWADVVDRLRHLGRPIPTPPPLLVCEHCGQFSRRGTHPVCSKKAARLRCRGCNRLLRSARAIEKETCSRCLNGYGSRYALYVGPPRYTGHICENCGGPVSPLRAKTCELRAHPYVCVNCKSPNTMNVEAFSRGQPRVNGVSAFTLRKARPRGAPGRAEAAGRREGMTA